MSRIGIRRRAHTQTSNRLIWIFFSPRISFAVYDVLTGKMVYTVRGHKDIVRDVSWHPQRNEILTSSWDFKVNLNYRGSKDKARLKRSLKEVNQEYRSSNNDDSNAPPPRRSKRLELRRQQQELA